MKINFLQKDNKIVTKEVKEITPVEKINSDMLAQYVRVFNSNNRVARANVKTRAEVSGGGKKPWRQKGTGNARAGSSRSPVWVGGGVTHGPRSVNWNLKLPKSFKKSIFSQLLSYKAGQSNLYVVEFTSLKIPNLKKAVENISKIVNEAKSNLIITDNKVLAKSLANHPLLSVTHSSETSAYDLLKYENILVDSAVFSSLVERVK